MKLGNSTKILIRNSINESLGFFEYQSLNTKLRQIVWDSVNSSIRHIINDSVRIPIRISIATIKYRINYFKI